jgi:hypothetical protein
VGQPGSCPGHEDLTGIIGSTVLAGSGLVQAKKKCFLKIISNLRTLFKNFAIDVLGRKFYRMGAKLLACPGPNMSRAGPVFVWVRPTSIFNFCSI